MNYKMARKRMGRAHVKMSSSWHLSNGILSRWANSLAAISTKIDLRSKSVCRVITQLSGMLLILACALCANMSSAQSISAPPVLQVTDQNGVNLATGVFNMPGLDIGIGTGSSGLARVTQGASDNFSGGVKINFYGSTYGSTNNGMMVFEVTYAGNTYIFHTGNNANSVITWLPGPYTSINNNHGTLSCTGSYTNVYSGGVCTLTLDDHTSVNYSNALQGTAGQYWCLMQSITKPDGEVITATYYADGTGANRAIKSISSTLGWMLKYEIDASYVVNKVTAINTSVAYCDPAASSCAVSSSFPSITATTSSGVTTYARNGVNLLSYSVSGTTTTIQSPSLVTKTVNVSSGKVASVVVGGATWHYAYSAPASNGDVTTTVTAPNNTTRKLTVSYDNKIVSETDEAGRTTSYTYDSSGRVQKIIAPDGNAMTGGFTLYGYDGSGNLTTTTVVAKGGAVSGVVTAGSAIVSKVTYVTTCAATYCGKPETTTDPDGVVTTYTYDPSSGQVATVTTPAPTGGQSSQTRNTYTQITPYVMNSSGTLVAQPPVWRLTASSSCMTGAAGVGGATPPCVGTTDERRTVTNYSPSSTVAGPFNNLLPASTTVKTGTGSIQLTTSVSYDNNGNVTMRDGPKPGTVDAVYSFYDALGRPVGTIGIDPDGSSSRNRQASTTHYNIDGKVDEVDTGTVVGTTAAALTAMVIHERNTNEYDTAGTVKTGLPIVARHFVGTASIPRDVTQRAYDSMFRVSCEAARLNPADYSALPSSACSLGTTNADGSKDRITKYNYDPITGALLSTISGFATSVARTDSLKSYDTSSSTSTGTLSWVEDAKGNRTSYTYDSFNRLVKTCYPQPATLHASNSSDCDQTVYKATVVVGGLTQASARVDHVTLRDTTTVSFGYDAVGRVASKSGAVIESFVFDNFGQVTSHLNNTPGNSIGGTAVSETYTYNSMGWLMSDQQPMGPVSYLYDSYGKRQRMTYPGTGLYLTYAYDDGDELTGILENGTTQIVGFTYDDYGRRTSLTRSNGVTTAYGYDATSLRLNTVTQGATGATFYDQTTYGYAPSGQINQKSGTNTNYDFAPAAKSVSYGIDGLNRIGTVSGTSLGYSDLRGNMTSDGAGGTFVYNANNLLTSATQSTVTTTLTYDASNRLVSIVKPGIGTTQFLYDGADLIAEYDGTGTLLSRYVHGPGRDEPLVRYNYQAGGAKTWYGANEQGSVTVATNASGAQVGAINTYDEYGLPGSGNSGRFQYTGQVWLPEIGMYYYKARMYQPVYGRFMQTDPSGYGAGMNWYAYINGDPVNGTDSTGLCNDLSGGPCLGAFEYSNNTDYGSGCDDETFGCGASPWDYDKAAFAAFLEQFNAMGAHESRFTPSGKSLPLGKVSDYPFLNDPVVKAGLNLAWQLSNPHAPNVYTGYPGSLKLEQQGFIVKWTATGSYGLITGPTGTRDSAPSMSMPCGDGSCQVLMWYHTHPNNPLEGYNSFMPSFGIDANGNEVGDWAVTKRYQIPGLIIHDPNPFDGGQVYTIMPWPAPGN